MGTRSPRSHRDTSCRVTVSRPDTSHSAAAGRRCDFPDAPKHREITPELAIAAHDPSLAPSMAPCLAPLVVAREGLTGQIKRDQH